MNYSFAALVTCLVLSTSLILVNLNMKGECETKMKTPDVHDMKVIVLGIQNKSDGDCPTVDLASHYKFYHPPPSEEMLASMMILGGAARGIKTSRLCDGDASLEVKLLGIYLFLAGLTFLVFVFFDGFVYDPGLPEDDHFGYNNGRHEVNNFNHILRIIFFSSFAGNDNPHETLVVSWRCKEKLIQQPNPRCNCLQQMIEKLSQLVFNNEGSYVMAAYVYEKEN